MSLTSAFLGVLAAIASTNGMRSLGRLTQECGVKGPGLPGARIIDGNEADDCEWVWQASLSRVDGSHYCGGVLLSEEWVLTAAQCIGLVSPAQVVVGAHKVDHLFTDDPLPSGREQWSNVSEIVKHPWSETNAKFGDFDLALVRLETPVTLGECVKPVCLPDADEKVEAGSRCYVTGWGHTGKNWLGQPQRPVAMQELEMIIVDHDVCMEEWACNRREHTPRTHVCARSDPGQIASTCGGDTGGPLVCNTGPGSVWKVFGVVSYADACSSRNLPNAFSDVNMEYTRLFMTAAMSSAPYLPLPPKPELPEYIPQTCCPQYCGGRLCRWRDYCREFCAKITACA